MPCMTYKDKHLSFMLFRVSSTSTSTELRSVRCALQTPATGPQRRV